LSIKKYRGLSRAEFSKALRLKDFEVKKQTIMGFNTTYVDGLKIDKIPQIPQIPVL